MATDLVKLMESKIFENPEADIKKKEDIRYRDFSWKGLLENVKRMEREGRLTEATSLSSFGQLARYGVQAIANKWYKVVPVVYPKIVQETTSKNRQEWYAPLYRPQLPKKIGVKGNYEETTIMGVDREIVNWKFGAIEAFELELFEDDQTGQIKDRAGMMGENMKITEEINVMGKLTGAALTYGNIVVDASNYTTVDSNGVSHGVYSVAVGNRPLAYARLGFNTLGTGYKALLKITDPLGNKMLVNPNLLVVSAEDVLNTPQILHSAYYPAVPGATGQTASTAASGTTGWTMSENPLQGKFDWIFSRYLPDNAWYLGEANKGLVFQRRDALEVVQEMPNTGEHFRSDVFRFKTKARWETEWIESRFWYCGDDGTV